MWVATAASYEVSVGDTDCSAIDIVVNSDENELHLILPQATGLKYQLFPSIGVINFKIKSDKLFIKKMCMILSLYYRIVNCFFFKFHRKIYFSDFILGVAGPYRARRYFYDFVRNLPEIFGNIDIRYLTIREFFEGWSLETAPAVTEKVPLPEGLRAVVVCHMYYMEVLEEIVALIASRRQRLDVIFTLPTGREDWRNRILEMIPDAKVMFFENMGRDVRPFLKVLEEGHLDDYEIVCKIHGKVSQGGGRKRMMGDLWRRRLLYDLLGNQEALDRTFERFAADRNLGMIGPAAYRCPGPVFDEAAGWSINRTRILDLATRMGLSEADHRLDFFAGTMFWARRAALAPLRRLALADSYFEPECGSLDGGPEHAVERIFGTSAAVAGMRIEDVVPTTSQILGKVERAPIMRKSTEKGGR